MARLNTYLLAAATMGAAFGIGYVMQHRATGETPAIAASDIDAGSIVDTSSASLLPRPVRPRTTAPVVLAAVTNEQALRAPLSEKAEIFTCPVRLSAEPRAGAMVGLSLDAPCYGSEPVTFHHRGMMFTLLTGPDGSLSVDVPALAEDALFVATFAGGHGAAVRTEVPALSLYQRVVLEWQGDSGLELHAYEFGTADEADGHVSASTAGDLGRTATGEGRLHDRARHARFARGPDGRSLQLSDRTALREGTVALAIEAGITPDNCGARIEAQTIELRTPQPLRVRELSLDMPGCDDTGDFLVLNNLFEDLKIAAR